MINFLCDRSSFSRANAPQYHKYITHVRHPENRSVIERQELVELLKAGTYTIG